MRRLLYIISILFCASAANHLLPNAIDDSCVTRYFTLSEDDSALPSEDQKSEFSLESFSLNFISGQSAQSLSRIVGGANYSRVVSQAQRIRNIQKYKEDVHLAVVSHPRHVTRLFNFDCVKSSMRVDYYLYALCRLRI